MRVADVMTKDVVTVSPETTLKEVARLLVDRRISGVPVVSGDGTVLGVVSEEDVLFKERRHTTRPHGLLARLLDDDAPFRPKLEARTAADAMSSPAVTIEPWRHVATAASNMIDGHIKRLPVVEGDRLVGIVTRSDLVKAFVRTDEEVAHEINEEILGMLLPDPERFGVTVEHGEVTLTGEADTELDADVLLRVVGRVPGVVSIASQVTWRENGRVVRS
jgi:CBS domain-containing protein